MSVLERLLELERVAPGRAQKIRALWPLTLRGIEDGAPEGNRVFGTGGNGITHAAARKSLALEIERELEEAAEDAAA